MCPIAHRSADVLCVGIDDAAMQTRRLILEKAGHSVTQARDLRRVKDACESKSFDVVMLGHSLNANEKKRITDVVLSSCNSAKILELHLSNTPDLPEGDAHLQVTVSQPQGLVEAVTGLLKAPGKKKARHSS